MADELKGYEEVTDPSIIEQVLSRSKGGEPRAIASKPQGTPQQTTIGQDILSLADKAPSQLLNLLSELPGEAVSGVKQVFTSPIRAAENIGAGAASAAKDMFLLPFRINKYLGEKGVLPDSLSSLTKGLSEGVINRLEDTGMQEAVLGQQQPGDALLQMLAPGAALTKFGRGTQAIGREPLSPAFKSFVESKAPLKSVLRAGEKISPALSRGIVGAGIAGGGEESNPLLGAFLNMAPEMIGGSAAKIRAPLKGVFSDKPMLKELANKSEAAGQLAESKAQQLESLKELAKEEVGTQSPASIARKASQASKQIEELQNQAQIPEQQTKGMLPAPTGEGVIASAAKNLENVSNKASEIMDKGASHDVEYAKSMKKEIEEVKKDIGSQYENLEAGLDEKTVSIPKTRQINELNASLLDLIKRGEHQSKEASSILKSINELEKSPAQLPASKIVSMFRTLERLAGDTRASAFERNITRDEHQARLDKASSLKDKANSLGKIIDKNLGENFRNELSRINSRWRSEAAPLYENPIYWQVMKKGRVDAADIMNKLRGSESGDEILRKLTYSNPDLIKNIVGHTYAENPVKMLDANRYTKTYINAHPELSQILQELKRAKQLKEDAPRQAEQMKTESQRVQKGWEEASKKEMSRQEAVKKIDELNKEIKKLETIAERLKKASREKDVSVSEKARIDDQIKEINNRIEKRKSIKSKLITIGAGYAIGSPLIKKVFSAITG